MTEAPEAARGAPGAAAGPLAIVYEDARIVAIDKPAGWLSVPSRMGEADERPCAGILLQEQLGVRLWPVHRLDLEVSGLLLFAKDADAHRLLSQAFEGRSVRKTYHGRSEGRPPADAVLGQEVRWESTLLRGKKRAYVHAAGKPAVTLATLLSIEAAEAPAGGMLQWRLRPLTGRAHQLRVELGRRGCPLCGDTLYGACAPLPGGGITLRAVSLELGPVAEALALPKELRVSAAWLR